MKNEVVKVVSCTEAEIADYINKQYAETLETANRLRMQMLGVGYVLVKAERELLRMGKLNGGNRYRSDGGFCAWLTEHCPAIPYKTAMDWKNLAERSLAKIGGETDAALTLMLSPDEGTWTHKQLEARDEILACETKGELKQMLFPFLAGRAGRPEGSVSKSALPDTNDPAAAARANWSRVIGPALNTTVLEPAARLLTRQDVEEALAALKVLVDYLNARKAELR